MARNVAHVLTVEPPIARLMAGKPKSENETPRPNVSASRKARNRKNGNCAAVGSGLPAAGG